MAITPYPDASDLIGATLKIWTGNKQTFGARPEIQSN